MAVAFTRGRCCGPTGRSAADPSPRPGPPLTIGCSGCEAVHERRKPCATAPHPDPCVVRPLVLFDESPITVSCMPTVESTTDHWHFTLAPVGRLLIPAVVFTPVVLAASSKSPTLRDLGTAILSENQAPRSFWAVAATTAWVLAIYLWLTRKRTKPVGSRISRIIQGPMDLMRGWLTAMSGMAVPIGLLALYYRMFLISIISLVIALCLAYTLDLGEHVLKHQAESAYDPQDPEQRRLRTVGIINSLVVAVLGTLAALNILK